MHLHCELGIRDQSVLQAVYVFPVTPPRPRHSPRRQSCFAHMSKAGGYTPQTHNIAHSRTTFVLRGLIRSFVEFNGYVRGEHGARRCGFWLQRRKRALVEYWVTFIPPFAHSKLDHEIPTSPRAKQVLSSHPSPFPSSSTFFQPFAAPHSVPYPGPPLIPRTMQTRPPACNTGFFTFRRARSGSGNREMSVGRVFKLQWRARLAYCIRYIHGRGW